MVKTDNDFKPMLNGLTDEDLAQLAHDAEVVILERTKNDVIGLIYNEIHTILSYSDRFSVVQVSALQEWEALNKTKKAQFKKAWLLATKQFVDRGFIDGYELRKMLIKLVRDSHLLQRLNFPSIIESLDNIEKIFNIQYPGYLKNGAVLFLRDLLNGREHKQT